jgi:uracil-DNA glycosylase
VQQSSIDWEGDWSPAAPPPPALQGLDPVAWPVGPGWRPLLDRFWASAEGQRLLAYLGARLVAGAVIYPPRPLRALGSDGPSAVRVVIVGQDPYHGAGQAEGLAFSVAPGVPVPPSLRNIFKEIRRDLGTPAPPSGSLARWVEQGVLLLNTALTVEDGQPGSHAGQGWEVLTDAVIQSCSDSGPGKVFMLWGAHAQKKRPMIDPARHLVLCCNHPSPLSASRGPVPFLGSGHFGAANRWLDSRGRETVDWGVGGA